MGIFDSSLKLIERIDSMRQEFLTMTANFKNLEVSYDKFVVRTEGMIDKIINENEDIRRRVTSIEATIDSTLKTSMKEAAQYIMREHIERNGSLIQNPKEIKNKLNENK